MSDFEIDQKNQKNFSIPGLSISQKERERESQFAIMSNQYKLLSMV